MKTKAILLLIPLGILFQINTIWAADYYWIGGSGNWEDITHWATTSGGAITHDQTPTANDDVYFDANSFTAANQSVSINSNIGFARTLDFSAATFNPTFTAGINVTLSVFGSLILTDNMDFDVAGDLVFGANTNGNTIDLGIHNAGANVTFDGSGAWTVISNLNLANILTISSGEVVFSNSQIDCQFFYSRGNANRTITLDNSILTITGITVDPQDVGRESNIYTSRIALENLNWSSNNSQVNFTSNYAKLFIEGNGNINFGRISTVNEDGIFELINIDDLSQISFSENLDLTKDATISADVTIGTLTLYGSHRYVFESQKSVTLSTLDATGSCLGSIIVASSISGSTSNWTTTMPILGDFLTLRDISIATNNATANTSIDLGNNPGWTINEKTPETLYWVGGDGNWNDGNNWSLTSGGPGSGCVPTAVDDVFFDQNSFNAPGQTVLINIPNALCRTMIWESVANAPTLDGPIENNLLIHGSLRFDPNMNHDFQGDYSFLSSSPNNSITSSGKPFNKDIYFNNILGGWILEDDIYVNFHIHFISGTLNTFNQGVDCFRFNSDYTNSRTLILGASIINLFRRENVNYNFWLESENLIFDAGTSTIIFNDNFAECISRGEFPLTYHNIEFHNNFASLNSVSTANIKHTFNKVTFWSNGQITGDNIIDTLVVKNGSTYGIGAFTEQDIDVLLWDDICDGLIGLQSFNAGATIRLGTTQQLEGFNITRINFDNNPSIQAIESVDGGLNQGVDFQPVSGRDLYWVGGTGDWDDSAHWAATSGGAGGECIPTIIDNVYFDDNSFTTTNDIISNLNGNNGNCRNITYTATNQTGRLSIPRLVTSGNVDIQNTWILPTIKMVGGAGPQTILTSGSEINGLEIDGTAMVSQLDDLYVANSMTFFDNSFYDSNGFAINTNNFALTNRSTGSPTVDLGTSLVTIRGAQTGGFFPMVISGSDNSPNNNFEDATFDFTASSTGMRISSDIAFGDFIFSAADGQAIIEFYTEVSQYESLTFSGNATLSGNIGTQTDSLIFAAGKTYIFESGFDYTINNHLDARGNNCLPISWQSSQSSQGINLTMDANVSINMDFVEMIGIDAICCNTYFAGNNSTDIANSNANWLYGTPDDPENNEGFFGPDIIVCDNNDVLLMPFETNQISSILWNDGTSDISYTANTTEVISAFVTFTNNCEIRDTIEVRFETSFAIDFGPDTTLCEGSSLLLNPNVPNANYEWQDMSNNATFLVEAGGTYAVNVDLGTCDASDTIVVQYQSAPTPPLPMTESACAGDSILLDAAINDPASYAWADGSTTEAIYVRAGGAYIVTITESACVISDTTMVTIRDIPTIEALTDTTICEGDIISVGTTEESDVTYIWNGQSAPAMVDISLPGSYTVVATNGIGCSNRDSMMLGNRPTPMVDLGIDTTICEGADITIGTDLLFDEYAWNTGASQSSITTDQGGQYILTVIENLCDNSDTLNLAVQPLPLVDFGPDQSICDGDSVILDANNFEATYLWNTGSINSTISASTAGLFVVEVNLNNCIQRDSFNLSIEPTPFFDLGSDHELCEDESIELIVPSESNWDVAWNTGSTESMIIADQSGEYSAQATLGNCSYEDEVTVTLFDEPEVDLGPDLEKCEQVSVNLEVRTFDVDILWDDGSTDPIRSIPSAGTYHVEIESPQGCIGRDTIMVTDITCVLFDIYLPTAFSPNGDNINDTYGIGLPDGIILSDYLFSVYDRWGSLVFQTADPTINWDGMINDQFPRSGPFLAVVDITYSDDFETDVSRTVSSDFVLVR